jgi:hypothetical protein
LWLPGGAWKSLGRKHCEFEKRLPKSYTNKWSGFVFFVGKFKNRIDSLLEKLYTIGIHVDYMLLNLCVSFWSSAFELFECPWLVISIYMSTYLKDGWGVVFRRLWISNFCV